MRNQIVALKHKADGMVSVRIPVPVRVFSCGNAVDHQVAAVIAVQAADDVEQGGLTGAAGTQDRHKLIVPQIQTDPIQGSLHQLAGNICFSDILNLKHCVPSFSCRRIQYGCICNHLTMCSFPIQDISEKCFNKFTNRPEFQTILPLTLTKNSGTIYKNVRKRGSQHG